MNSAADRPNVLLIMADQHRWDCTGFNGNRQIQTPNLDALAADGVNYANTICPFPVCTPSRYSIVSGLYVHQHGGWSNHCTLGANIDTFPKTLRAHGYATKAVGKMHYTPTYLDVGYEQMELCEQDGDGRFEDDYHRDLMQAELIDAIDLYDQRREYRRRAPQEYWDAFGAMTSDLPEEWHSTTWIGDRAVKTLEGWTAGGNLLTASFVKPHHPFDPPAPWDTLYDPAELELLPGWRAEVLDPDTRQAYFDNTQLSEDMLRRIMAHYYGTISHIDHQVGRMLGVLRARGLYDNTMVLYLSDHGEYLGWRHMILKQGHAYEPLARVPLLIKYPHSANMPADAGTRRDVLANLVDVAPTILQQTGLSVPAGMLGLNLADPAQTREIAFLENLPAGYYMARSHTHKLILDRDPAKSQFFDLAQDPYETHNLMQEPAMQPLIAQFEAALSRWLLFDSPTALRLDLHAPQIDQPNVPEPGVPDQVRAYLDRMAQLHLAVQAD